MKPSCAPRLACPDSGTASRSSAFARLDGFTVLPGRRVAMHLMAQPDVAAIWFGDRLLVEQGLHVARSC